MDTTYIRRETTRPNNESFKEKYQILLTVNDNVICQRYFKVNDYIPGSIQTLEFVTTMRNIVDLIKNEIVRKSRIYEWYTANNPMKLTGFRNKAGYEPTEEETFFYAKDIIESKYSDDRTLEPYEVTFKFSFLVDEKPVYEEIWDGTQYQKYVRSTVDLLNSCPKTDDVLSLPFREMLRYKMCNGEGDKIYKIIHMIYDTITGRKEGKPQTKSVKYRKRDGLPNGETASSISYTVNAYNRKYVEEWREYTKSKTAKYMRDNLMFGSTTTKN